MDLKTSMTKSYLELITFDSFLDRFKYLKLNGVIGLDTFGHDRYLNQKLYRSYEWKRIRDEIIVRDNGCDLGMPGYNIFGKILVHHINPISPNDIMHSSDNIFDLNNLICVSHETHNAIHYGDDKLLKHDIIDRFKNDTIPWRI